MFLRAISLCFVLSRGYSTPTDVRVTSSGIQQPIPRPLPAPPTSNQDPPTWVQDVFSVDFNNMWKQFQSIDLSQLMNRFMGGQNSPLPLTGVVANLNMQNSSMKEIIQSLQNQLGAFGSNGSKQPLTVKRNVLCQNDKCEFSYCFNNQFCINTTDPLKYRSTDSCITICPKGKCNNSVFIEDPVCPICYCQDKLISSQGICNSNPECLRGQCSEHRCVFPDNRPRPVADTSQLDNAKSCTYAFECESNEDCVDGRCRSTGGTHLDINCRDTLKTCPNSYVCISNTCWFIPAIGRK